MIYCPQAGRRVAFFFSGLHVDVINPHSRKQIAAFVRRNPYLHLYELGDLDDFFWPHTVWFAAAEAGELRELALLYTGQPLPTLLALAEPPLDDMRFLLANLQRLLPRTFYAHLHPGAVEALGSYRAEFHGLHHKMGLLEPERLTGVDTSGVEPLAPRDESEVATLYAAAYPGNWFMPRMLETGFYFGCRLAGQLVSVAGVHVCSRQYRAAALGNITTHPDYRGRSLARQTTAGLCQALREAGIGTIGLNVRADNRPAIACYERLGFCRVADYGEYTLTYKR